MLNLSIKNLVASALIVPPFYMNMTIKEKAIVQHRSFVRGFVYGCIACVGVFVIGYLIIISIIMK